jgi:hypothetical protein
MPTCQGNSFFLSLSSFQLEKQNQSALNCLLALGWGIYSKGQELPLWFVFAFLEASMTLRCSLEKKSLDVLDIMFPRSRSLINFFYTFILGSEMEYSLRFNFMMYTKA